VKELLKSVYIC